MRVLDLFAGIGGFSLAAHWMGWETAAFVEWDKFCQKVAGSHANPSATQENETERQMTATSGRKCYGSLERLNRQGLLAKTLLASSRWTAGLYSKRFALRWRLKGTPSKRLYCQLFPVERRTEETGFGLLLKTPSAGDCYLERMKPGTDGKSNGSLSQQMKYGVGAFAAQISHMDLLPTPKSQNANHPGEHGHGGKDLQTMLSILGTPTSRDWKDVEDMTNVPENGLLGRQISNILSTPTAAEGPKGKGGPKGMRTLGKDIEGANGANTGMKLQPAFVEYMMGYPEGWTDLNDSNPLETP